ncbi:MAG: hypothetical protein ACREK1_11640, partial [Longimicrobiales bacterium]
MSCRGGGLSLLPLHYGPQGEVPAEAAVARWLLGVFRHRAVDRGGERHESAARARVPAPPRGGRAS